MGVHHSAAKRDDDGAAPTSPAMLATPLAGRKAPAAPTVLFGNSVNTADSVRTKSHSTMQLASIGMSAKTPGLRFQPTESFGRNPGEKKGGTLGHATGGLIIGPKFVIPGQVVVKEVVAKSVNCLVQLKDELLKLFEQAKKAASNPGQMAKDMGIGIYEGLKEELGGIWEAIKSVPEVAGAFKDLMGELQAGEIDLEDLVGGLSDLAGDLLGELVCGYVNRAKAAAAGGATKAAQELGKLSAEIIAKMATSAVSGGAGAAAGMAGRVARAGKGLGNIGDAIKKRVRDRAARRRRGPDKDDKPQPAPAQKPSKDDPRPDNSAESNGKPGGPCKNCPTAATPGKPGGRPVNPILGIKVLFDEDELDFSLPAPLPVVWQRFYSSDDARIGLLGQGWVTPGHLELEVRRETVVLIDGQGRRITFDAMPPGAEQWSPEEMIWLRRGGNDDLALQQSEEANPYAGVPTHVLADSNRYFLRSPDGIVAVFAPVTQHSPGTPQPPWPCVAVIDRLGQQLRHVYDAQGHLLAQIDSAGRVFRMAFTQVKPIRRTDSGRRLAGVWLAHDPVTAGADAAPLTDEQLAKFLAAPLPDIEAPGGRWLVRYRYHGADLTEVIDALGQIRRRFGWRHHVMVSHQLAGGLLCEYEYDHYRPSGRVVREVVDGFELRFDYEAQATHVTDALGRRTSYHFEGQPRQPGQRWTGLTHPDGSQETYTYSPFGQLIAVTDELGRITRYELDPQGRTVGIQAPDGASTRVAYDASGEISSLTNPLGHTRRWWHDSLGRLSEEADEAGYATHYFYDDARVPERPTRIRDAHGSTKRLQWDAAGQLVAYTDCSGQTTRYQYDGLGQLVAVTDALGHTVRHQVDAAGRLLAVQHADGATERFAYDAQGRLIAHRDALGHDTHWRLNPLGQPVQRIDALGHSLRYEYDAAGRLATLINENNDSARFAYDVRDRLIEETGFDERRTAYQYNAAGELTERLEHGSAPQAAGIFAADPTQQHLFNASRGHPPPRRTAYVRDAAGRLLSQYSRLPSAPGLTPQAARARRQLTRYRYDAAGQLLEAASPSSRVHFEWDSRGLLSAEQALTGANVHASSQPKRIEHTYDGLGARTQTRLPDGRHLNFLHYGSGHLHQVNLDGRVLTDIERDKLHRQTQRSQGLLQSQYSYDAAGRLIGQRSLRQSPQAKSSAQSPAQALIERHYRYDAAGQLLARAGTGGSARYTYDAIGRLLAAVHDQGHSQYTERFAFDPASNLIDDARIQQAQAQARARAQDSRSDRQREEDEWAETVRRRLADPSFDLLGYQSRRIPDRPPGAWAGNRLLVYEDKRFAWDRHGNLLAKKSGRHKEQHFAYDAQGQLTHVLTRSGLGSATARQQLSEYGYDALGRRVAKRVWPARPLRLDAGDSPEQEQHLPAPSFAPPKGQPHTSQYLWEGNRLLQESTPTEQRTYVWEPDSFIPMLRIDDERTPSENSTDNENRKLSKQELLALDTRALEAQNASNLEGDEEDADNFASLKAQAWGRMVPGQVQQHLAGLRSKAEQLQNPSKEPSPKPSRILHYHCDHLGTPRELTDEDGKLVWSADYWAWGKVKHLRGRSGGAGTDIASPDAPRNQLWHTRTQPGRANHLPEWVADNTGNVQRWAKLKEGEQPQESPEAVNDPSVWGEPTDQSIRFQGQWHDPETGLHYNRFRYYDPDVGRFIHQDPIGFVGGINWYQYAPTPTNYIDPLGLNWAAQTRRNNGQFGPKPPSASPRCGGSLHRPYIRADIRRQVEARAAKASDGSFLDANTRLPISGAYHLGHRRGHEFWREKAKAESNCMTQEQFNDYMNNADFYQIEDPKSNMSHKHEDKSPL